MIEVNKLTKLFDGFAALDELDMTVPKSSVYGLVGPNGAGKSTVLRHITGIYKQDSGSVLIEGQPVFENNDIKSRIAFIPDDVYYFPQAGVRDMMKYYSELYPKFDHDRYKKLSEVFSFSDKTPIRRMSKGMQKQAAFWLAMCLRPEYLILDEPVDGLDPVMRRQVWSIIMGDVAENGTTVLVSSHNLRELEDVCDYVGIIHNGKTILERSLTELQDNIVKVQIVYPNGGELPKDLSVLHHSRSGKISTYIIKGRAADVSLLLEASSPIFYDIVPLTLEEIFIYELGGADYNVKDILL
ncbi:MAG: ABC transporter ATP-binding protein [Oscillospiraceae bacterium]|nr:ABC transporter ATP-binding protein [Oscillospiraceae bacterium]